MQATEHYVKALCVSLRVATQTLDARDTAHAQEITWSRVGAVEAFNQDEDCEGRNAAERPWGDIKMTR